MGTIRFQERVIMRRGVHDATIKVLEKALERLKKDNCAEQRKQPAVVRAKKKRADVAR